MGDLNARHTNWDSTNNPRGVRRVRYADKRGWEITRPEVPSPVVTRSASSPDILRTKTVTAQQGIALLKIRDCGSDQVPVNFKWKWNIGNQRTTETKTIP